MEFPSRVSALTRIRSSVGASVIFPVGKVNTTYLASQLDNALSARSRSSKEKKQMSGLKILLPNGLQ